METRMSYLSTLKAFVTSSLRAICSAAPEGLTFARVTAVVTTICFLYSSVFSLTVQAMIGRSAETAKAVPCASGMAIPFASGKVTDAAYFDSDRIVINIQDLHCHGEVQRNIAKILGSLDENYHLKTVYVEGSAGKVDTSWVNLIQSKEVRTDVAEALVDGGKVTGAEYYSIRSGRKDLLEGLEDSKVYDENLQRLNTILGNRREIESILPKLQQSMNELKGRYFSTRNMRLEELMTKNKQGKIDPEKYFNGLIKLSERTKTDTYDCPEIRRFIELTALKKGLDYKKISKEMQECLSELKTRLPYTVYTSLVANAKDPQKLNGLYLTLAGLSRDYKLDISRDLPHLAKFFQFIEMDQQINSLKLVHEERHLVRELHERLARTGGEKEVALLSDLFTYFEEYLNNKLSAKDYEYFQMNMDRFETLWPKYVRTDKTQLEPYHVLLDAFYRVNIERNSIFLKKIGMEAHQQKGRLLVKDIDHVQKTIEALKGSKEIIVMVTGGFHTSGLSDLLKENNVSYLVITPNVTKDSQYAEEVYEELAKEQAEIANQTMALQAYSKMLLGLPVEKQLENITRDYVQSKLHQMFAENKGAAPEEIVKGINRYSKELGGTLTYDKKNSTKDEARYIYSYQHQGRSVHTAFIHIPGTGKVTLMPGAQQEREADLRLIRKLIADNDYEQALELSKSLLKKLEADLSNGVLRGINDPLLSYYYTAKVMVKVAKFHNFMFLDGAGKNSVQILVVDAKGQKLLLQKRGPFKRLFAGKYTVSANAKPKDGQSLKEAATAALEDEIGISGVDPSRFKQVGEKNSYRNRLISYDFYAFSEKETEQLKKAYEAFKQQNKDLRIQASYDPFKRSLCVYSTDHTISRSEVQQASEKIKAAANIPYIYPVHDDDRNSLLVYSLNETEEQKIQDQIDLSKKSKADAEAALPASCDKTILGTVDSDEMSFVPWYDIKDDFAEHPGNYALDLTGPYFNNDDVWQAIAPDIVSANEPAAESVAISGGKGANTATLKILSSKNPDIDIPDTYIITTRAYERYVLSNKEIREEIDKLDRAITTNASDKEIKRITKSIREKIRRIELPDQFQKQIAKYFVELGRDVAVRSSANVEDMKDSAAAGEAHTSLHNISEDETIKGVKDVWASLFDDGFVTYRNYGYGFANKDARMAVLLQQFVKNIKAAGVVISIHPNQRPMYTISAQPGIGEGVVQGEGLSDKWYVGHMADVILGKQIATKTHRVVVDKNGGTKNEIINDNKACLSDEQVLALSKIVRKIHRHYFKEKDTPQIDLEYVFDGSGKIHIVQTRPKGVSVEYDETGMKKVFTVTTVDETKVPAGTKVIDLYYQAQSATYGAATAHLQVIASYDVNKAIPGNIIVTHHTNNQWNDIFARIPGVITTDGDPTSHAGLHAQEKKIPCVVGAIGAMDDLRPFDGKIVTLDSIKKKVYLGKMPIKTEKRTMDIWITDEEKIRKADESKKDHELFRDWETTVKKRPEVFKQDFEGNWRRRSSEYPYFELDYYYKAWDRLTEYLNNKYGDRRPWELKTQDREFRGDPNNSGLGLYHRVDVNDKKSIYYYLLGLKNVSISDYQDLYDDRWSGFRRIADIMHEIDEIVEDNVETVVDEFIDSFIWMHFGFWLDVIVEKHLMVDQLKYISDDNGFHDILRNEAVRDLEFNEEIDPYRPDSIPGKVVNLSLQKDKAIYLTLEEIRSDAETFNFFLNHGKRISAADFKGASGKLLSLYNKIDGWSMLYKRESEDILDLSDTDHYLASMQESLKANSVMKPELLLHFYQDFVDKFCNTLPPDNIGVILENDSEVYNLFKSRARLMAAQNKADSSGVSWQTEKNKDALLLTHMLHLTDKDIVPFLPNVLKEMNVLLIKQQEQQSMAQAILKDFPTLKAILALWRMELVLREAGHHLILPHQRKLAKMMLKVAEGHLDILGKKENVFEISTDELIALVKDTKNPEYIKISFKRLELLKEADAKLRCEFDKDPGKALADFKKSVKELQKMLREQADAAEFERVKDSYRAESERLDHRVNRLQAIYEDRMKKNFNNPPKQASKRSKTLTNDKLSRPASVAAMTYQGTQGLLLGRPIWKAIINEMSDNNNANLATAMLPALKDMYYVINASRNTEQAVMRGRALAELGLKVLIAMPLAGEPKKGMLDITKKYSSANINNRYARVWGRKEATEQGDLVIFYYKDTKGSDAIDPRRFGGAVWKLIADNPSILSKFGLNDETFEIGTYECDSPLGYPAIAEDELNGLFDDSVTALNRDPEENTLQVPDGMVIDDRFVKEINGKKVVDLNLAAKHFDTEIDEQDDAFDKLKEIESTLKRKKEVKYMKGEPLSSVTIDLTRFTDGLQRISSEQGLKKLSAAQIDTVVVRGLPNRLKEKELQDLSLAAKILHTNGKRMVTDYPLAKGDDADLTLTDITARVRAGCDGIRFDLSEYKGSIDEVTENIVRFRKAAIRINPEAIVGLILPEGIELKNNTIYQPGIKKVVRFVPGSKPARDIIPDGSWLEISLDDKTGRLQYEPKAEDFVEDYQSLVKDEKADIIGMDYEILDAGIDSTGDLQFHELCDRLMGERFARISNNPTHKYENGYRAALNVKETDIPQGGELLYSIQDEKPGQFLKNLKDVYLKALPENSEPRLYVESLLKSYTRRPEKIELFGSEAKGYIDGLLAKMEFGNYESKDEPLLYAQDREIMGWALVQAKRLGIELPKDMKDRSFSDRKEYFSQLIQKIADTKPAIGTELNAMFDEVSEIDLAIENGGKLPDVTGKAREITNGMYTFAKTDKGITPLSIAELLKLMDLYANRDVKTFNKLKREAMKVLPLTVEAILSAA